jgi:hypothetical protein
MFHEFVPICPPNAIALGWVSGVNSAQMRVAFGNLRAAMAARWQRKPELQLPSLSAPVIQRG